MKERPILFCGEMVRAILDGRKTQTRRIVKDPCFYGCLTGDCPHEKQTECDAAVTNWANTNCPYGQPGDRLWVKETFCRPEYASKAIYRADLWPREDTDIFEDEDCTKRVAWKPSIFMPRGASRITLEIESVGVERVQHMSNEDAQAEGIEVSMDEHSINLFADLWDSINGKTHPWASNPWVWVLTFHRVKS